MKRDVVVPLGILFAGLALFAIYILRSILFEPAFIVVGGSVVGVTLLYWLSSGLSRRAYPTKIASLTHPLLTPEPRLKTSPRQPPPLPPLIQPPLISQVKPLHTCAYCGSVFDKLKCPSCGAPIGRRNTFSR